LSSDSIEVVSYNEKWPELAAREIASLSEQIKNTLGDRLFEIHHIGSTAVPGLRSKPILDLLVAVDSPKDADLLIKPIEKFGYSFWRDNPNKWHYFFVKGLPLAGGSGRTHHIHLVENNHDFFRKKILFRDYLRSKPEAAREYEVLKDQLSLKFPDDREAYTEGKTEFVNSILRLAEKEPSAKHLAQVENLWRLRKKPVFHRYLANHVYFSNDANCDLVVRLTPSTHRSKAEVLAEVSFMDYLAKRNFPLAIPVASINGLFVEEITSNEMVFSATVFKKIEGLRATDEESLNSRFLFNWGAHLAQLHLHSIEYGKSEGCTFRRPEWDSDSVNVKAATYAGSRKDLLPSVRLRECVSWLRTLEKETNTYGLIHGDLHRGNFFVVDGQIVSFDYDDSCFHWFLYDLAASLSTVLKLADNETDRQKTIDDFFKGYESLRPISMLWKDRFEGFYQYRLALVFNWMNAMIEEGRFSAPTIENWKSVEPWYLENLCRRTHFT
jgi:Ser/Thr protein kinase RdoA (MazF antagonist)/GrpB-like predicted nucleotidyltransferase (UPF0157 family)